MEIKLAFLGAAKTVTGSRYFLECNDTRLLIDCGLFQEREYRDRNWYPFLIPPDTIDAVLLTHAHLDHNGLLPKLVRDGFQGKVYCTGATSDISEIMLLDSAKIQEEDAEFKRKRHEREGRKAPFPEIPLYTSEEAKDCLSLFTPVQYGEAIQVGNGIEAKFHDAGHVFGSSMIKVSINQGAQKRTILFSGDVGRWDTPILRNPTIFSDADYVIVESTYGDRIHENMRENGNLLAQAINSTLEAGGNIVVPSFALERAQEILYYMNELLMEGRIPRLPVFLDSPMAVSITKVFQQHPNLFDREMAELVHNGNSPFDFPGLQMVRTVDESKAINDIESGAMIIAGSGMCTGGRIKHHLIKNIDKPANTILFVGYQAAGTLGREIIEGAEKVRILGNYYPVRAKVAQIHGFSAHADRDELFRWLSGLKKNPVRTFVTHGEAEASQNFSIFLQKKTGWNTSVPEYRAEVVLE